MVRSLSLLATSGALALLGACARGENEAAREPEGDPVVAAVLADPLMTDPDLASQSLASAALGGGGPARAEIPLEPRDSADAVAAARAEAERLAGAHLAPPAAPRDAAPLAPTLTAPAFAALLPGAGACAAGAGYGFIWAAALPVQFPVYPRGHAQEGAGNDLNGCRLRAVNFTTPVAAEDIAAFYLARARAAGMNPDYLKAGDALVVRAARGKAAVLVRIARGADGVSEVDLATSGL